MPFWANIFSTEKSRHFMPGADKGRSPAAGAAGDRLIGPPGLQADVPNGKPGFRGPVLRQADVTAHPV
jgi:hypothetical protein